MVRAASTELRAEEQGEEEEEEGRAESFRAVRGMSSRWWRLPISASLSLVAAHDKKIRGDHLPPLKTLIKSPGVSAAITQGVLRLLQ